MFKGNTVYKMANMTRDTDILQKTGCSNQENMIINRQMCWVGHIISMEHSKLPKQLIYCKLTNGEPWRQKPRENFKDCVKSNR